MLRAKSTKLRLLFYCFLLFDLTIIAWVNSTVTLAQIIPDRTLPNNSQVDLDGNLAEINGGTVRGANLFHSFTEFSIDLDNLAAAHFNNSLDITNIISRVTGNSGSQINGLIKANGAANLFLINPNGIIFGNDAVLDIGGSFVGSTADSLQFNDGKEFSAVNTQSNALLTVNIPAGLQYGKSSDITVLGSGHGLTFDDQNNLDRHSHPRGLSVGAGKTLALVGRNVFLSGGNLSAPAGKIELGGVGRDRLVELTPDDGGWQFNYAGIENFGRVELSGSASLDVSGDGGGDVRLRGDLVKLTGGSTILSNTWGKSGGGLLDLEAREIEIAGTNANRDFHSSLFANVDRHATGDGSNILITSDRLLMSDGGQIYLNNYGWGNGGNLTINAIEIELDGSNSGFSSTVRQAAKGNGADINLHLGNLTIREGAQIVSDTEGIGDGGDIAINAQVINLTSEGAIVARAIADVGNGGDIAISTNTLAIQNGATIYTGNFATPQPPATNTSGELQLFSNTATAVTKDISYTIIGTGEIGNISINAGSILLNSIDADPSSITTATFEAGGGNIKLKSDRIVVAQNSQIVTETKGDSHGGAIYLVAEDIELINGGKLSTSTFAGGNAGKISIATDFLRAGDNDSGVYSLAGADASGMAGDIQIIAETIDLEGDSRIDTTSLDRVDSSAIEVQTEELNPNEDTVISSVSNKIEQPGKIDLVGAKINADQKSMLTQFQSRIMPVDAEIENFIDEVKKIGSVDQLLFEGSWEIIELPTRSRYAIASCSPSLITRVASQNFNKIYLSQPSWTNSLVEAQSWIVNPQGNVELLARSCS